MPSIGIQELLVEQEISRISRRSRDAWMRHHATEAPATRRFARPRRALGRPRPSGQS